MRILREADKSPVRDVIKKHWISEPTFYAWKREFGGMDLAEAKKLRVLESKNPPPKKLLAVITLENSILKEVAARKWCQCPCGADNRSTRTAEGCRFGRRAAYSRLLVRVMATSRS